MTTRREFLSHSVGAGSVITVGAMAPEFLLKAASASDKNDQRVLVVVQLSGGNDGLNTVVPYTNELYYKGRAKLGIPKNDVLKINSSLGWHPAIRGFADLLEENQLAIVQGVGYPNPNRSHFESMDIWHTCQRKGQQRTAGWLGRFLDRHKSNLAGDVAALHLGGEKQPLALASLDVRVPSLRSLDDFKLKDAKAVRAAAERLTKVERPKGGNLLSFIQSSTSSALTASQRVEEASMKKKSGAGYPKTALAEKLQTVAQLIGAGLSTRIYYVALDGFDTHSKQPDAHAGLLRQLGGAVTAFMKDLKKQGQQDRVLTMCFSEFGRRVQENASDGTDHGAAAPMFMIGSQVKSGILGKHPKLDDLVDGDVKHHTDFRQVYAGVLENWLGTKSAPILGGEYKPVSFLKV